jgi:hypothetical protein
MQKKKEKKREKKRERERERGWGWGMEGGSERASLESTYRAIWILRHEYHEGATATAEWPELGISSRSVHRVDAAAATKAA